MFAVRAAVPAVERRRLVVDPVWRVVDKDRFDTVWEGLVREAARYGFVGLDLEWTTRDVVVGDGLEDSEGGVAKSHRVTGPVATVQLSTRTVSVVAKLCDLVHLANGTSTDPFAPQSAAWPNHRAGQQANSVPLVQHVLQNVSHMLADTSIAKVGVGILGDQAKLHADYPAMRVESCVDLVSVAEAYLEETITVTSADGAPLEVNVRGVRSLKDMATVFAGRTLDKSIPVVKSDWGGALGALSPMQTAYAAADAEASFDICCGILHMAGLFSDREPCRSTEGGDEVRPACGSYLLPLVSKAPTVGKQVRRWLKACTTEETKDGATADDGDATKAALGSWCKGRAKPYYDNINVYDPHMTLVFTVDKSKAEWYVYKKGIAEVIEWRTRQAEGAESDDAKEARPNPLPAAEGDEGKEIAAIRLHFAPDFRKFNDAHIRRNLDYFKQPKENICVVCGGGQPLVRFAVIPLMYRRFFPSVYMSHNSYDLLLLCTKCFARSRVVYEQERRNVSADFGIPLSHLAPKALESFRSQVEVAEARLAENCERFARDGDDTVAHHIHPAIKLTAMKEFAEIQHHREIVVAVLKYAKALHGHYGSEQASAPMTGSPTPPLTSACAGGVAPTESGAHTCKPNQLTVGSHQRRSRAGRAVRGGASAVTMLPEARRCQIAAYVDEHAPKYPFFHPMTSSLAEQQAVFATHGASSAQGVAFILGGDGFETSFRAVLTRWWVEQHPELLEILPSTTRAEEHAEKQLEEAWQSAQPSAEDNDGAEESVGGVPFIDSHGFLVVKLLLQKYRGDALPQWARGPAPSKNADHAIGQFIYRWRRAFVDQMKPEHLPRGWVPEDGIIR